MIEDITNYCDSMKLRIDGNYPQYDSEYYWVYQTAGHEHILKHHTDINVGSLTIFDCAAPSKQEVMLHKLTSKPTKPVGKMTDAEIFCLITQLNNPFRKVTMAVDDKP